MPENNIYLPYKVVFSICKYHQDHHIRDDGSYICFHPSIISREVHSRACNSINCPARQELQAAIRIN